MDVFEPVVDFEPVIEFEFVVAFVPESVHINKVGGGFNPSDIALGGGRVASVLDLHRSRADRGRR